MKGRLNRLGWSRAAMVAALVGAGVITTVSTAPSAFARQSSAAGQPAAAPTTPATSPWRRIVGSGPTGEASGVSARRDQTTSAPSTPSPSAQAVPTAPAGPVVQQPAPVQPVSATVPTPSVAAPVADNAAARALVRLERLENELRAMTDRVERLEAETRQLREENARLSASGDRTTAAQPAASVASEAVVAEATPTAPQATQGVAASPASTGSATSTAVPVASPSSTPATGAAPTSAAAPARVASLPAGASAMSVLREARLSLQTRDYPAAERSLAALVATWPDAPEADEGRWLLGETRFVQQAWAPAAEAYVAYLGKSPQGRRVPEIYIRLAGVFRNVNDEAQRCRALNAFRDSFPDAGPVMQARYAEEASRGASCPG